MKRRNGFTFAETLLVLVIIGVICALTIPTTVTKISFNNCRNNADIVLYRINNGGHTWPDGQQYSPPGLIGNVTRDINANELMWEFFQRYSL